MSDLHSIMVLAVEKDSVDFGVTIVHPDEHYCVTSSNFALQLILMFYEHIKLGYIYNSSHWQYFPFTQEQGNELIADAPKAIFDELIAQAYGRKIPISEQEYNRRQKEQDYTYQGKKVSGMGSSYSEHYLQLESEYDNFCAAAEQHIALVELLEVDNFPHWFDRVETHIAHKYENYYFEDEVYELYEDEPRPYYKLRVRLRPESAFLLKHLVAGSYCGSACYDFLNYATDFIPTQKPLLHTLAYSVDLAPPADEKLADWWNGLEKEWRLAFCMNLYIQQNWLYPQIKHQFAGMIFKPAFQSVFGKEFVQELADKIPTAQELRLMSQLKIIYAGGFKFTDLNPLRILNNLKLFYAESTPLENIEALGEMKSLGDLCLIIYGDKTPSQLCLKNLTNLRKLYFDIHQEKEIEVVLNMPQLADLQVFIWDKFYTNYEVFLQIPQLEKLTVSCSSLQKGKDPAIEKIVEQLKAEKGVEVRWEAEYTTDEDYELIEY